MAINLVARSCGRLGNELGVTTLYQSKLDVNIPCLQRFIRLFAYSGTILILALFLADLGLLDTKIWATHDPDIAWQYPVKSPSDVHSRSTGKA